jgi:DNA-binding beta-propeller fold protein YncE
MKKTFLLLVGMYLLSACSGGVELVPTSTFTPEPSTPTIEVTMTPVLPVELNSITAEGMNAPYGIAFNSLGNIYVNDAGSNRVLVFDAGGNLLEKWDKQGSGEGEFKTLGFGSLAIDANDNVFVVDIGNSRIQKFDKDGNFMLQWGSQGKEDGQFIRAIGITTDKDGNVYVTDDGNPYVQKFDNNGTFLMKFGGEGEGDGQFSHATGIAVDAQGNIFVADYENKRLQKFDAGGTFITSWQMGADVGVKGIPEAIAVDAQGKVYVSDYVLGRMQVFDNNGNFLWALGGKMIPENPFKAPTGIAFGADGKLYVVNQGRNNISVYQLP